MSQKATQSIAVYVAEGNAKSEPPTLTESKERPENPRKSQKILESHLDLKARQAEGHLSCSNNRVPNPTSPKLETLTNLNISYCKPQHLLLSDNI